MSAITQVHKNTRLVSSRNAWRGATFTCSRMSCTARARQAQLRSLHQSVSTLRDREVRGGRTKHLHRRDGGAEDEHGARDEQDVLEHAREREDEAGAGADKEDGGDVEREREDRVREQDQRADLA
jgi:hypothetical protein